MKHINSRPSEIPNIGEEVLGAARHRNDTFDNPEHEKQKRMKKESNKALKALKEEAVRGLSLALSQSTEAAKEYLKQYETKKCSLSHELFNGMTDVNAMKSLVLSETNSEIKEVLRKLFNRMIRAHRNIRYLRPIEVSKYFDSKKKDSFMESNGRTSLWDGSSLSVSSYKMKELEGRIRALQFGNSVPDGERAYVIENLNKGLDWFSSLVPSFDLKQLAFAFGARGNARSVAFYQDGKKLISVNRHNEGSIVHELGHAIDYALGSISDSIPYEIRSRYREQLLKAEIKGSYHDYLMKRTEIFARLFEVYIASIQDSPNEFMLFCDTQAAHMPQLDPESLDFITKAIAKLKGVK